jgi:hypothetical protein
VNIGGMGMMSDGELVMVDAMLQSDGSIQAQTVQWFMGNGGAMTDGIVSSVTGTPAAQMGMVVQNGSGQGMNSSFLSNNATVNPGGGTLYGMNSEGVDLSNLPFTPMFDANHIYSGECRLARCTVTPSESSYRTLASWSGACAFLWGELLAWTS